MYRYGLPLAWTGTGPAGVGGGRRSKGKIKPVGRCLSRHRSSGFVGVRPEIADARAGPGKCLSGAPAALYGYRNVFSHTPGTSWAVAAMLKAVRARENREVAQRKAGGVEQTGPAVCYDSAG